MILTTENTPVTTSPLATVIELDDAAWERPSQTRKRQNLEAAGPQGKELCRLAEQNPPPQAWFDEDMTGL
jgi:hypothetical protein